MQVVHGRKVGSLLNVQSSISEDEVPGLHGMH